MAGGARTHVVTAGSDAGVRVAPSSWVAEFRWRLAAVDPRSLSDRERVDLVAQLERLKGTGSATQARSVHALSESRPVRAPRDAVRSVGSEVALARRESPTLGDRFVRVSRALVMELPFTLAALDKGMIGERHAMEVVQQSAVLSAEDRAELDRRLGPVLGRLTPQAAGRAARRVAAELDAASVVARMERAARSRRVSVRPAADGMAYLSILAPRHEVVGAHAALRAHAGGVVGGQRPEEPADGRAVGAVMADTATRLLSGRAVGQAQPVVVHHVMTNRALLGVGDPGRSVSEPARIPRARVGAGAGRSRLGARCRRRVGLAAAAVHNPGRARPRPDGVPTATLHRAPAPHAGAEGRPLHHPVVRCADRPRRPHHGGSRRGPHRCHQRLGYVRPVQPGQGGPRLEQQARHRGARGPGDRGTHARQARVPVAVATAARMGHRRAPGSRRSGWLAAPSAPAPREEPPRA